MAVAQLERKQPEPVSQSPSTAQMSKTVLPEPLIRLIMEFTPVATTAARLWYHEEVDGVRARDGDVCVVFKKNKPVKVTLCGWWQHSQCRADAEVSGDDEEGDWDSFEIPEVMASHLVTEKDYVGSIPGDHEGFWDRGEFPMDLEGFWDRDSDGSWSFCCTAPLTNVVKLKEKDVRAFEERLADWCNSNQLARGLALIHTIESGYLSPHFIPDIWECGTLGTASSEPSISKKPLHLSKTLVVDQIALVYARLEPFLYGYAYDDDEFRSPYEPHDLPIPRIYGTVILDVDPVISAPDDANTLDKLTKPQLQTLCRANRLPVSGRKSDLVNRLLRGTPAPLSLVRQQYPAPRPRVIIS